MTIYTADDDKWLLLNYEAAAYCRVNYDERNWRLLQRQLRTDFSVRPRLLLITRIVATLDAFFQKINTKSRGQLLDDALQLARYCTGDETRQSKPCPVDVHFRAGYLPYNVALDTTIYLINETSFVPWQSALGGFGYLEDMLTYSPEFAAYKVLYSSENETRIHKWVGISGVRHSIDPELVRPLWL